MVAWWKQMEEARKQRIKEKLTMLEAAVSQLDAADSLHNAGMTSLPQLCLDRAKVYKEVADEIRY